MLKVAPKSVSEFLIVLTLAFKKPASEQTQMLLNLRNTNNLHWQRAAWGSPNNKKIVRLGNVHFLQQQ